jgi:hypothetical protein
MSAEALDKILALLEAFGRRLDTLERTAVDNALALAEIEVRQEVERDERQEVDDLLASKLGGTLVRVERSLPPADLRLVVDNDNDRPEGGA